MKARPSEVELRWFEHRDIDAYCDYFYRSPPGFRESIGLAPSPRRSEDETRRDLIESIASGRKKDGGPLDLAVVFNRELVGIHSLSHFKENESAILHSHFFRSDLRGQGIGTISYVKAIEFFLFEYGLKEIIFKTPVQNRAAVRIKEKLGLVSTGEEMLLWNAPPPGVRALVYSVSSGDLPRLKNAIGWDQ